MSDSTEKKFRTVQEKIRHDMEMTRKRRQISEFVYILLIAGALATLCTFAVMIIRDNWFVQRIYDGSRDIDPGIYYKEPKKTDRVYPEQMKVERKKTDPYSYRRDVYKQSMMATPPTLNELVGKKKTREQLAAEISTPEWWRNKFRNSIRIYVMPINDITMKYYNEYLIPEYSKGNRENLLCISDWMQKNMIYSSESREGQKFLYRWACFIEDTKQLRHLDQSPSHVIVNAVKDWDTYFPEERK